MSILRASHAVRHATRLMPKRNLAIMPTVKTASDTSQMDFPAPSHVSLTSTAAELARQLTEFYSNPDSVINLSEEARKSLEADITKRVGSIPDSALNETWTQVNVEVPEEIRLGDNPYFEVYKEARSAGKLE